MKTVRFHLLALAALGALPLLVGCNDNFGAETPSVVAANEAPPPALAAAEAEASTNAPSLDSLPLPVELPLPEGSNAVPASTDAKPLPPNIWPNSPLGQVIKMAQSGVDDSVLLAYVTNSGAAFLLGSDEIIYLSDLGVDESVITAMIQRDQQIKQNWSSNAAVATAATASAPTYVTPPQPAPVAASAPVEPAPVSTAPPAVEVGSDNFYDTLSPYGSWVTVEGYGQCWQPNTIVLNRNWRPYVDRGHWVYSDAGWYWASDYSWGWATFHYGRWFEHPRFGWCWWPDTLWAPSWVTWRTSGAYCGWAPLPPRSGFVTGVGFAFGNVSVGASFGFNLGPSCYNFVSIGNFLDPRPYRYCVPRRDVDRICRETVVINDFRREHDRVFNHGIPPERITAITHRPVQTVAIREHSNVVMTGYRAEQIERNGRSISVYRPQFQQRYPDSRRPTDPRTPFVNPARSNPPSPRGTAVTPNDNGRGGPRGRGMPDDGENRGRGRGGNGPNNSANPSTITSVPTSPATPANGTQPSSTATSGRRGNPAVTGPNPANGRRGPEFPNRARTDNPTTPQPVVVTPEASKPAPVTTPPPNSPVVIGRRGNVGNPPRDAASPNVGNQGNGAVPGQPANPWTRRGPTPPSTPTTDNPRPAGSAVNNGTPATGARPNPSPWTPQQPRVYTPAAPTAPVTPTPSGIQPRQTLPSQNSPYTPRERPYVPQPAPTAPAAPRVYTPPPTVPGPAYTPPPVAPPPTYAPRPVAPAPTYTPPPTPAPSAPAIQAPASGGRPMPSQSGQEPARPFGGGRNGRNQ